MALDAATAEFVQALSQDTGIDPRVLTAWVEEEGANAKGGTGHFNYLNLRPYPGDPYQGVSAGGFEEFSSVAYAIDATSRRLHQPFAAPILAAAKLHPSPQNEIAAIAGTGWDKGHYGGPGGPNLEAEFQSIFGPNSLTSPYQGPGTAAAVTSTAGTGSASDVLSYSLTDATGAVGSAIQSAVASVTGFFSGIWQWFLSHLERLGLLLAGAGLIVLSAVLISRSAGVPSPVGV